MRKLRGFYGFRIWQVCHTARDGSILEVRVVMGTQENERKDLLCPMCSAPMAQLTHNGLHCLKCCLVVIMHDGGRATIIPSKGAIRDVRLSDLKRS